jgi:hypothetical protein
MVCEQARDRPGPFSWIQQVARDVLYSLAETTIVHFRMKRLLLSCRMLLPFMLAGCVDHAPAYNASILTYDEGMLGQWNFEAPAPEDQPGPAKLIPFEVTAREDTVTHGRLGKYNESHNGGPNETKVPAYRLVITVPREEDEEVKQPLVLTYQGILLKVNGSTFFAYQPASDRKVEGILMDYYPVHRVIRIERDGNLMRLHPMKTPIVWFPGVLPLDEPQGEPTLPIDEGTYFVADADRLVQVLSLAIKSADAWHEPVQARRRK